MAIGATAVWEMRTTAGNGGLQGGFYTSGGTDYSQQDNAQATLTDLSTDAAGTTVTSAGGGFTSAMVGNGIYLTGGNSAVTTGWYEIKTYVSGTVITIDRSAGASKGLTSGATGRVGGATYFLGASTSAVVAGNTIYVKSGTYTLDASTTTTSGTTSDAIKWIGYNSSRNDNPTGNNRPSITQGANYIYFGDYNDVYNFKFSSTNAIAVRAEIATTLFNCYSENTSGTAGRYAFYNVSSNNNSNFIDCEATSSAGIGMGLESLGCFISHCYIHDCGQIGINFGGTISHTTISFSIIDTCVKGIVLSTAVGVKVLNCVFYNNSTSGIETSGAGGLILINNIFDSNGTGVNFSTKYDGLQFNLYNWWYNNATDVTNYTKELIGGVTGTDPLFVDDSGGNFSLASGSTAKNTGFSLRLGIG